jgi:hypothetical protein
MVTTPQTLAFIWIAFALSADISLAKHYRRRGWVTEGPDPSKRKTSWVVWLLLLLLIPAFIYVAVTNMA